MATGTGLDAQIGWGQESTWGTPVTPTRFPEFTSEGFSKDKVTVQGMGLRAGGRVARAGRRLVTTNGGKGSLSLDLVNSGLGILFKTACGTATSTQRSSTPVYDQVFTLGALLGKSMTIQKGVPSTDGTVNVFEYNGVKITDLDVSISKGGLAQVSANFDARQERTADTTPAAAALATASYSTTATPFSFLSAQLTLAGSAVAAVTKANVKLTRPLKTDRYYLNGGGTKSEQLENGYATIGGTLEADFTSLTALYSSFETDASLALVLSFTGPVIAGSAVNSGLTITVPAIKLNGDTPKVGGPDVVSISCAYDGLDDGTNPPITYAFVTADTTF